MIFGALLALGSAFSFSVNSILVRRGFADAGATAAQGAFITVLLGVPFGLAAVVVTGQLFNFDQIPPSGYALLAAAGIVHFGVGRYSNYRSIAAIGASRTVTLQAIAVPYSIVMAIVLLGERPTLPMYLAIGLILVSPFLMIDRGKRPSRDPHPPPQERQHPLPGGEGTRQASGAPGGRDTDGGGRSLLAAGGAGVRDEPHPDTRGAGGRDGRGRHRHVRRVLRGVGGAAGVARAARAAAPGRGDQPALHAAVPGALG